MEEGDGHAAGIAEAIRAWRQRRGWTQEELSHASGLSTRAIRSLERGRTLQPRRTTVQMLADALQVPRARLTGTVRRAVGEAEADGEAEPDGTLGGTGGLSRGGFDRATSGEAQWADGAAASSQLRSGGAAAGDTWRAGTVVPRELPPDLGDHELDVREVVAELVAGRPVTRPPSPNRPP